MKKLSPEQKYLFKAGSGVFSVAYRFITTATIIASMAMEYTADHLAAKNKREWFKESSPQQNYFLSNEVIRKTTVLS